MIWLQNILHFLALNLLRFFAFLPYMLTVYIGYSLGWLAAHIPICVQELLKPTSIYVFPSQR